MTDIGIEALRTIHKMLLIDEPWTVWHERQFSWIGHRLEANVEASEMFVSRGILVSRLTTTIEVIEEVQAAHDVAVEALADLNRWASHGALVYLADERSVRMMLSNIVHSETSGWRPTEHATAHILSLAIIEKEAVALADRLGGKVAKRLHPLLGARRTPDDLLNVVEQLYAPAGAEPSRFADSSELQAVEDMVRATGGIGVTLGPFADGISIEVAFGAADTTLIDMVSNVVHPMLGHGLSVLTTTRMVDSYAEACRITNRLNVLQFAPGSVMSALGAWFVRTIGEDHHIAHVRFVPNLYFTPGFAVTCGAEAIDHAIWVDRLMHPDLPERSALGVVNARLRRRGLPEVA